MKLEKRIVERKINIMKAEGVNFVTNVNVGTDVLPRDLMDNFDCVILACGASKPRDINVKGREAKGIEFAVDFLKSTTKALLDNGLEEGTFISAKDRDVIVIGGGDTGNDCVGTCVRHGAKSILQLEMMPKLPDERAENNPWPEYPRISKTDYGQEEAAAVYGSDPRLYQTTVKEFIADENGNLKSVILVKLERGKNGGMVPIDGSETEVEAQLVLIAAGFLGSESYVTKAFGAETDNRGNVAADGHRTNVENVYVAGDMRLGQSLVVRAIREGIDCARDVDKDLIGYSNL
jgi:glutamate synthase (NADPH/NADH) small chain